jgi:histidinol phosphatase-like PHP family hydrolase
MPKRGAKRQVALYDFHTHTVLSDGVLIAVELIRRAMVAGYTALGICDHTGAGALERVLREIRRDCQLAWEHWGFRVVAGVELTHVPASSIAELAAAAKALGAAYVVVHGESPVEPVEPGTNLAAASCPDVDVLAHPGLLDEEAGAAAAQNGVFLEVTAKDGHSLGNGRVVQVARLTGARLLLGSDAHGLSQLLTPQHARHVLRCAGLSCEEAEAVISVNGKEFLDRCLRRLGRKES